MTTIVTNVSSECYMQDFTAILNKAKQRWRLAFTAICSVRILASVQSEVKTSINLANKRWRVAFTAIYSSRAITSLYNQVVDNRKANSLRTPSFVAIDIEPEPEPEPEPDLFSNINKTSISKLVKDTNKDSLLQFGGVDGLLTSLQTNEREGINGSLKDLAHQQEVFGRNQYHKRTTKGFFHYVLITMKDPIIIVLLLCAFLSLVFNICEEGGLQLRWYGGESIFIAVLVVVIVCSVSHFWPSRQFNKFIDKYKEMHVEVVRGGQQHKISASDVVCINTGNHVPADGLSLSRHSLKMDESGLGTDNHVHVEVNKDLNSFLSSGTKVNFGHGRMLIISQKWISLDKRLKLLTKVMGITGSIITAISMLLILFYRYFTGQMENNNGSIAFIAGDSKLSDVWAELVGIMGTAVVVASSAIPEGLPLAVAIAVSYTTKRMIKGRALLRRFSACDPLASASTICTDITGILTLNQMKVCISLGEEVIEASVSHTMAEIVQQLIRQGIGLNISQPPSEPEEAINSWAIMELGMDVEQLKKDYSILHAENLIEEKKHSKILIRKEDDQTVHEHIKGSAEDILAMCSHYYDMEGNAKVIDNMARMKLEQKIQGMAHSGLKCMVIFAHKKIQSCHERLEDESFTLLALMGLRDPIRRGVTEAVQDCRKAGVKIKVITGDGVSTATAIASQCGILGPSEASSIGEVIEAVEFRNYTEKERLEKVDKVCVIANASYVDKLLFVQCLKQKGHVVAVTGTSTEDAPALKEANVAIHIGFQGNDIAVENSDILILNDGFVSVVTLFQVARSIYDNIKLFIQFSLTANVATLVTDIVFVFSSVTRPPTIDIVAGVSANKVPYAVLQILWVKLIIGTLAALAIVVEQEPSKLMQAPPMKPDQTLISNKMLKNILINASYEIVVLLTLHFKIKEILGVKDEVMDNMIFNLVVLFLVFAVLKARRPEGNIFEGIRRRKLFWVIISVIMIFQVAVVNIWPHVAKTKSLNLWQWGACIGIAFTSWPVGFIGSKYIPCPEKPFLSYIRM